MAAPIRYFPSITANESKEYKDGMFETLQRLDWIHADPTTPREEFYWNAQGLPYTYGTGPGRRTYQSQDDRGILNHFRNIAYDFTGVQYDVCFLNRYRDSRDQLNWHSDSSPEMDNAYPIVIQSFGEERQIYFRKKMQYAGCPDCGATLRQLHNVDCEFREIASLNPRVPEIDAKTWRAGSTEKVLLQHGSLCIMQPGMQVTWEHRIPKHDREGGVRISLTWRKYLDLSKEPE